MNIILLSGGSGKRLWPLSNDIRSKQFIKIFKTDDGYQSMVQRVYAQIRKADPDGIVTIATSRSQVSSIHNQIGENVSISVEPCRRDTFPAIALATAYLHDIKKMPKDDAVVVCPVDPYVDDNYFVCIRSMYEAAKRSVSNLVLMGIQPTYPSEKYGYIKPLKKDDGTPGYAFMEKPTEKKAREYIEAGALWNGGVFAYKLSYVLEKSEALLGTADYNTLFTNYADLKKISFDYAVVEHETSLSVLRYSGQWTDIGSWNTLTEAMSESIIGDAMMDEACTNTHIINELDVPILAMGVHDMIISASPDGILVSDKDRSGYLKKYVESNEREAMFAEKSWGSFKVIDAEKDSLTIKVTIKPKDYMNYHSHDNRDEVWVVVCGEGRTIVDGMEQRISSGDVITMKAGCRHTVIAETELKLVEVQIGKEITAHDKHKYPFEI